MTTAATPASFDHFLEERPLPLVALVGCTGLHSCLTSRRPAVDDLHARYLSLPEDTTRLDHVSSGEEQNSAVLKRDWLHKHTYQVAAVVSLWFTWEADTRPEQIVTVIERFRARLRDSCKIAIVLVSKPASAPFGPPSSAKAENDERLSVLRKTAELDSKQMLSITHTSGEGEGAQFEDTSVRRVERALLEAALSYYKDESRNNKKAKQGSNKTAAPHLTARFHFKRAYYSEVRRDAASAAKHWQGHASSNVRATILISVRAANSVRQRPPACPACIPSVKHACASASTPNRLSSPATCQPTNPPNS